MKYFLLTLLVASCATTATPSARRPDPRDQRREAQSASVTHADFEPHTLRDRPFCDAGCTEAR